LNLAFLAGEHPGEDIDALIARMMLSYVAGEIEV
jgi:hypothetical protein